MVATAIYSVTMVLWKETAFIIIFLIDTFPSTHTSSQMSTKQYQRKYYQLF